MVHRDIKPENILLSERGEPLVADFGIALAVAQAGGGRITETGLSLGTPHYMSPEQATGDRDVDPRSDVFALGCVLYEMLAAQTPFAASTAQAILVKVLTSDPVPITGIRRTVPPHVEAVLARALEKLPADRFESAAEFAAALEDEGFRYQTRPRTAAAPATPEVLVPDAASKPWHQDRRLVTSLVAGAALAMAAWWLKPPPPVQSAPTLPVTRSILDLGGIEPPTPQDDLIVSPDGSRFAFVGTVAGQRAIYWRNADQEAFRIIPGTENATNLAFSPDSDWLVYVPFPERSVMKVSVLGGAPTPVVPAGRVDPRRPHWGDDSTIVFTGPTGLQRVRDTGGEPVLLRAPDQERPQHPSLLPGGRGLIGTRGGGDGIVLLDLETDSIRELVPNGTDPRYVETGHILYADDRGELWALPFVAADMEVTGDAVPVLSGLTMTSSFGTRYARYSVSRNGTLVYGTGGGESIAGHKLVVVPLDGSAVDEPLLGPRMFFDHQWSPNGRSVAYGSEVAGESGFNIFTYDVELGTTPVQVTFEGVNVDPVWSPDGTRIAFRSQREGTVGGDLFVKNLLDNAPPEMLLTLPGGQTPTHWPSADTLVFENQTRGDLWILDMSLDSAVAREYLPSEGDLDDMRVSPTGDLAVYSSVGAGAREIYVRTFPEAGAPARVSQGGGRFPFWSPDGNTIYYWSAAIGLTPTLIAAHVQRGPPFVVTSTDSILQGPYIPTNSDLHPDGDRIVTTQEVSTASEAGDGAPPPERFLVVVNWFEELKQKTGGR